MNGIPNEEVEDKQNVSGGENPSGVVVNLLNIMEGVAAAVGLSGDGRGSRGLLLARVLPELMQVATYTHTQKYS